MRSGRISARVPPKASNDRIDAQGSERDAGSKRPGLYLVATPIGNARDISLRALDILRSADLIACEDTRITSKLLAIHGIAGISLCAYHDHNAAQMRPVLLAALAQGKRVALVSDAGMPLIADPGYRLARAAREAGHYVTSAPGASAALAALALSGLPTDRFFFAGFLPERAGQRRSAIRAIAAVPGTLICYEAPQRLQACLADLAAMLGPRPACVARELTKLFEELRHGDLAQLAAHYERDGAPKGEIVIVIGPPQADQQHDTAAQEAALDAALAAALGRSPFKQALADVAASTGLPRRQVYARALRLKDGGKRP